MTSRFDRRHLLKLGAVGIAGVASNCATVPKREAAAAAAEVQPPAPSSGPPTRVLGRTGLRVPVVSMGVMNADNPNLVRAALEGGIVLLDTAHVYQAGRNEEMLGEVLKGRPRDSYLLCTKVALSTLDRKTGVLSPETRGDELVEKLDISLKRLGLDHVDVLYLHNMSRKDSTLSPTVLAGLERAKKEGKTRFLGVSTHKNEPEVIRAAIEAKLYDVVLTAYNFRQDHHLEVQKAMGEAAAAGLGVVAMKTQAGVYWDKEKTRPIDMRAALRWAVRDPNVHTTIPGFTTLDQLQVDLAVLEHPELTDEDRAALEPPKLTGFYCQGCEACRGGCRSDLAVPELMRAFMYAHAYRNREAAQALLLELDLPRELCAGCDACAVECAKGFDVRERIADVVRLRDVPREFLI